MALRVSGVVARCTYTQTTEYSVGGEDHDDYDSTHIRITFSHSDRFLSHLSFSPHLFYPFPIPLCRVANRTVTTWLKPRFLFSL